MTILGFTIERVRLRPAGGDPLTDEEIAIALGQAHDKHPLWQSILQLLRAYEEAERLNIGVNLDRSDRHVIWSAGAADGLAKFRDELIRRRDLARKGVVVREDGPTEDVFHRRERPRGFIPETDRNV